MVIGVQLWSRDESFPEDLINGKPGDLVVAVNWVAGEAISLWRKAPRRVVIVVEEGSDGADFTQVIRKLDTAPDVRSVLSSV